MNASSSIIVWEWEFDAQIWVPHSPKLCQHIENEYRRCSGNGSVDLGGQDTIAFTGFQLDFVHLKQANVNTNESMKVRRQPYPGDCAFAQGITWKWSAHYNQMQPYDVATSNYIEDAFQKKSKTVNLRRSPLRIPNLVQFQTMEQINKTTRFARKIQREETKERYPRTNYETNNIAKQHGAFLHGHNPLPTLNGPATMHSSNLAAAGSTTQIHYPAIGSNNVTFAQRNLNNPSCRFSQPSCSVCSSTVTHNSNPRMQLTSNPAFPHIFTVGTSTMINTNTSNVTTRLPQYHPPTTPYTISQSQSPSSYGVPPSNASGTSGMAQASSGVPVASSTRKSRKQARKASAASRQTRAITGPLANFARSVQGGTQSDDECAICLESLSTPSDYDNNPTADVQCLSADVLELVKCKHMFHRLCLQRLHESGATQNDCLRCPTCKTIHGVMKGNQPAGGTMRVTRSSNDIPGYPGCGSIVIVYVFASGTQGPNHPNPGQPYHANAFPRTCYLPNNAKGKKVLSLLKIAFDRQLIFTVGRSVTTGQDNCIVWNDIHHKTEGYGNGSGYGYPDPNYLDNVLAELASHGVTEYHQMVDW